MKPHVKPKNVKSLYGEWQKHNRAKVLKLLSDNVKIQDIATLRNCSATSIYRLKKRMVKDKLITENNELTDEGFNNVKNYMVLGDDVKFNNVKLYNQRDIIDLHKLHITITILEKPTNYDYRQNNIISLKVRDYSITDLKHNYKEEFKVNDVRVKTNINSVEIHPGRIIGHSEQEVTERMFNIIFDVIKKVENLHNIKLIKENYCNIRISEQHWELIRNEMAKIYKTEEKDQVFRVFDEKDGKVRLVVDFSHGTPNFEAEHYSKAPNDIKIMKPYFDELADKGKDYFLEMRPRQREKYIKEMVDDKNFYYPTENAKLLNEILTTINQIGHAEKFITDFMASQIPKRPKEKIRPERPEYIG